MIKKLKLSNFRLFNDEVTVRFRPITVLIGRNNAGKSSVIKFLLMLQQSRDDSAAEFLNPEGERVKLGSFESLKNSISKKQFLNFELDVQTTPMADQVTESTAAMPERKGKIAGINKERVPTPFPYQQSEIYQETQTNFTIMANVPYNRRVGNLKTKIKNNIGFQEERKEKIRKISLSFIDRFTRINKERVLSEKIIGKKNNLQLKIEKILSELTIELEMQRYLLTLIGEITNIKHISPTRVSFSRVIELATPPRDSVGQNGEYAILHLQRLMAEHSDRTDILSTYLESLVDVENVVFRDQTFEALRHITASATNSKTKARSYLSEFGFGVSQIIPVLVQGVIMDPYTQFMVEEPEAQLHPTAQLELGSYFADIWKECQVGSIIETHSGNIILRLRRLIAKGDLKPEDVSVAFFDIEEGKPVVKNLDIDSDGAMQEGLPMEFFGADIIEGLELGAGI